jgi:hypothetical protein
MLRTAFVATAVAAAFVASGSAQSQNRGTARTGTLSCNDRNNYDDRVTHCEVREDTIGGANPLDIDAGRNGGIHVRGWDRGDVSAQDPGSRRHRRRRAPPRRRRATTRRAAASPEGPDDEPRRELERQFRDQRAA